MPKRYEGTTVAVVQDENEEINLKRKIVIIRYRWKCYADNYDW